MSKFNRTKLLFITIIGINILGVITGGIQIFETLLYLNDLIKPTLQVLFSSFILFLVFFPILLLKYGIKNTIYVFNKRAWIYLLFAVLDLQGFQFYNKAIDLVSFAYFTLIKGLASIITAFVCFFLLNARYKIEHYAGFIICIIGIAITIIADQSIGRNYVKESDTMFYGLLASLLYVIFSSFSFIIMHICVKQYFIIEFIAFYGFFGSIISLLQMLLLENYEFLLTENWKSITISSMIYIIALRAGLIIIASCFVYLTNCIQYANATLLTEFFYLVLANFVLQKTNAPYKTVPLHYIAYGVMLLGICFTTFRHYIYLYDMIHKFNFYKRPPQIYFHQKY